MATLKEIAARFSTMQNRMRTNVRNTLYVEGTALIGDFQQRSPTDTGLYKSQWKMGRGEFGVGDNLGSIYIYNPTKYAEPMEYGGIPGGIPWHYPGSGKKSKNLTVRDGRVWAGGVAPGFSKTVGGAIGSGLVNNPRRLNKLANSIADAVIGAL